MHPLDRLRENRLLPVLVGLAIIAASLFLLRIGHILSPFFWAAITAYLLFPLVARIERVLRVPRVVVIVAVYLLLAGLVVVVGLKLVPTAYEQIRSLATSLPQLIVNARKELVRQPELRIGGIVLDTHQLDARIDDFASQFASRFGREAVPLVLQTFDLVIKLLVYLLATFYFLLQGDVMLRRLRSLAPAHHRDTVERVTAQVNETFGAYIRAQLILFVIMTVATFTVLSILHVQYALVVAIASGALELIPIIGPWSAGAIATLVALSQRSGPFGWSPTQLAVVVAISYLVLRMIEDQVVIPQIVGRIVRLHPLLVIFGVLAGASVFGILGLVLAVPILAALKIVSQAIIEELRHPPERRVVPLREPGMLLDFQREIAGYAHQHVVLLIVPGAVGWDDLETAQTAAAQALMHDIRLEVVTPDQVAASIATAAGIEVATRARLSEDVGLMVEVPPPVSSTPPASAPERQTKVGIDQAARGRPAD